MRRLWPLWFVCALSACRADVSGLIFYTGFEDGYSGRCGRGWRLELPERPRVPGRFLRAYRMEPARANLLTANQASVDTGLDGFVAGANVRLTTLLPKPVKQGNALQAAGPAPGVLWTLSPRDLQAQNPHRPTMTFVLSAYLRADKPGAKVRLTLRDELEGGNWRETIEAANRTALEKDPKAKVTPPFATVTQPGELVLTGQWQRVMALLELDNRRKAQKLVGGLELLDGAPAAVLADNLQLEQVAVYPTSNTTPTTWLPGGERLPAGWLDFAADRCDFEGRTGTVACWVRPLPDECGGTRPVGPALALGTGWFAPVWTVGGGMWYACNGWASRFQKGRMSVGDLDKRLLEPGAHDGWHHLALAWDEQEAVAYCDGVRLGRCSVEYGKPAYGTTIRLGGSFLERAPMCGDLDEVCLFARRLGDEEVAQLAQRDKPLSDELPPPALHLRQPARLTFLRSEAEAVLPLAPNLADRLGSISAAAPAFGAKATGQASAAKPLLLKFKPWLMPPGKYPFKVEVSAGDARCVVEDEIEVFEEPQGRFIIYGWGGTDDLEKIGLNAAVVGGAGAQRELLERGLWANSRATSVVTVEPQPQREHCPRHRPRDDGQPQRVVLPGQLGDGRSALPQA